MAFMWSRYQPFSLLAADMEPSFAFEPCICHTIISCDVHRLLLAQVLMVAANFDLLDQPAGARFEASLPIAVAPVFHIHHPLSFGRCQRADHGIPGYAHHQEDQTMDD